MWVVWLLIAHQRGNKKKMTWCQKDNDKEARIRGQSWQLYGGGKRRVSSVPYSQWAKKLDPTLSPVVYRARNQTTKRRHLEFKSGPPHVPDPPPPVSVDRHTRIEPRLNCYGRGPYIPRLEYLWDNLTVQAWCYQMLSAKIYIYYFDIYIAFK